MLPTIPFFGRKGLDGEGMDNPSDLSAQGCIDLSMPLHRRQTRKSRCDHSRAEMHPVRTFNLDARSRDGPGNKRLQFIWLHGCGHLDNLWCMIAGLGLGGLKDPEAPEQASLDFARITRVGAAGMLS